MDKSYITIIHDIIWLISAVRVQIPYSRKFWQGKTLLNLLQIHQSFIRQLPVISKEARGWA